MKTIKVASLFWLITLFLSNSSYAQNSVTLWNKGNVTIIENPDSVTFKSPNSNHNVRNITYWKNGISTVVNTPDSLFFWNADAYNSLEPNDDIIISPFDDEEESEKLTNDEENSPEITYTEEEKIKYDNMAEELISLFGSDNDNPFLARKATNDDERAEEAIMNNGVNELEKDNIIVAQQGRDSGLWGKTHFGGFETYYYAYKENGTRYLLVVFRHKEGGGFPNKKNAYLKVGQVNSGTVIGPVVANIGQEFVYIRVSIDKYIDNYGYVNFFPLMITEGTKARNYLRPIYVRTAPMIPKDWRNKYYGFVFGKINGVHVIDNTNTLTGEHNLGGKDFQCVNLCARYITELNENIIRENHWGHAIEWPVARKENEKYYGEKTADYGKYKIYPNDGSEKVREGDVLVWDHGDFGHVGVVINTLSNSIWIAHQNGGDGTYADPIGAKLAVENKIIYDRMPDSNRSPIFADRSNITHFIRIYNPNEEIEGYGVSMNASTTKLDFRRVKTGERPNLPFTITNTGYLDLKISSVKISNRDAFSTDLTECIIKKGEERTFYVTFSPRNPENYEGRLLIESNAEDNYAWAITLLGTGYGDPLYKDLALSQEEIDMKEGESTTVDIISGNGKYSAYSLEDRYVSAYVPNGSSKVNITAVSAGKTSVVVKDEMSGDTKHIKVNVEKTADLTLSDYGPFTLEVGGGVSIDIDSGNGDYTAESDDEGVAKAYIKQKTKLVILATGPGNATITVSDKCGKTKTVAVSVNDPSTSDDVNLVKNGDMEGTDVSNFFVKINAGDINPAVISNGVGVNGSRGIKVAATARVSETWDNQFWVRLNRPVSAGTKYRFSFNYRADKSADVSTEYHAEPSEYIDWGEYITFTSAWKSYSKEGTITSSQSKTDMPFQSIAFTLNNYAGANNYYFDNIKFEVLTDEEEPPVDLKLSSTAPISLEVGEGATLEILSGNGGYNVKSDKENVATAAIKHETTVVIVATGPGEATITVSDKSGKTKKISVTVKDSSASGWINLVNNSDMEGSDVSSFYERTGTWEIDPYLATISNGVGINGSRGIKVKATQKVDEIWDNQFWVRFNQPISEGTKYRFSFNYRADKNAEVREEFHAEPSEYLDWISDYINFTTNWQTFSQEGVVESNQSKDDMPFQSIAFDLNVFEGANNYYFDNFKFEVILDGQCPKPTFKLNGNKLSIQSPFTTRIYYTLDGTTPTTRSSVYTSPLALNQSCIVKAIAVVDASNISPVAAYTYSGEVEEEVDERIEDVIPSEYRDKVEQFIPIYDGINPPNVEGSYYMDLDILMGSSLSSDKIGKDFGSQYFKLSNQNSTNNTINMVRVQNGGSEWAKGEGAFISGSGNNFTIYFNSKGESSGVPFVMAYFISGTKTSDGIKNLNTGFILKEKGNDPQDKVVPVGTYRFFKDGNGMSESKAWPYGDKYGARKRTNNVNVLPGELGANY